MFDDQARRDRERIAKRYVWPAAALLAVAEVESGGNACAVVNSRKEPLIRFEGHYSTNGFRWPQGDARSMPCFSEGWSGQEPRYVSGAVEVARSNDNDQRSGGL